MAGKDKESKKATSMFGKDGFSAWLKNLDKATICHEQEEDKSIYAFPDTITDEELEDYTIRMDKERKYLDLVKKSQDEYRNHPKEHKNTRIVLQAAPEGLCREINLYTYWQGFGYAQNSHEIKIKYLLVAQDWGNPSNMSKEFEERIKAMNRGEQDVNYLDKKSIDFQTDANLIELFNVLGYDSIANRRYADLFFTNFCLGYRAGKESGGMTKTLMMKDSGFFKELCDILEPENILCLGRLTFKCVYETLIGQKVSSLTGFTDGYNTFIEKHEPITAECGRVISNIYPLAHCGSMGTMNRNKNLKDDPRVQKDTLFLQKEDWGRIKAGR